MPQNNNPSFKAFKIAEAKTLLNKFDIYEVSKKDMEFLTNLKNSIRTKKLMPNLPDAHYKRWDEMLEYAVNNALQAENKSFISSIENKPCGIITFNPNKKIYDLNCICTFPVEYGKKVSLAGKTLFYQLFDFFIKGDADKIKLRAITDGPYNTVENYSKLGFIQTGTQGDNKILMETNVQKIKETIKRLSKIINLETDKEHKNIDLIDTLWIE